MPPVPGTPYNCHMAAAITFKCGHNNIYSKPWPKPLEYGYCHRCEDFQLATHTKKICESNRDIRTGYSKKPDLTVFTNQSGTPLY